MNKLQREALSEMLLNGGTIEFGQDELHIFVGNKVSEQTKQHGHDVEIHKKLTGEIVTTNSKQFKDNG